MSIITLDISEPFFTTRVLENEDSYTVNTKTIVLNLSEHPIKIEKQELRHLQSVVVAKSTIYNLKHAVLVERFAEYDDEESLLAKVREEWPSAFEIRGEERLRGIGHICRLKYG